MAAGLGVLTAGLAGARHRGAWLVARAGGIGMVLLAVRVLLGPTAAPPPPLPAGSGPWEATVETVGAPRDGAQGARLVLHVADAPSDVPVAATLPAFPTVRAGMRLEVSGRLKPPPEDDPYGEYLRRTGAAGSLTVRAATVLDDPDGTSLAALRDGAGDALRLVLPEPEAGLAAGILVGLKERVDRALAADFATAGASHVVAISGWNISVVAGVVGALLRRWSRRTRAIGIGLVVVLYVIAAGASSSVVRAAVMAGVVLLARETGRAGRAAAALALASLLLLLAAPELVLDAGFRLSVMATAGLLAWATPFGERLAKVRIPGTGGRTMPGPLAESLGISFAAQAATLPDVLVTFGRLSLISPVVNLLVVPLVPLAMAAGAVALLAGWAVAAGVPAIAGIIVSLPAWLLLHVMVAVVRAGAAVPYAALAIPPEIAPVLAVLSAILVLAPGRLKAWRAARQANGAPERPRKAATTPGAAAKPGSKPKPKPGSTHARWVRPVLAASALALAVSGIALANVAHAATRLSVLDIGQGDAILLESASGGRILVDGGPDPDRLLLVLDERIPPWDRRIDVLVLTHPHEDHVDGLVRVLERYEVGRVFEPGMHGPGPGWDAWDAALRARPGIPRVALAAGDRLRVGELDLRVLWPGRGTVPVEPGSTGREINDTSIVLLGSANGRTFLLTGDAEDDVDPELIATGLLPRLDVLKVAHHGSATATSAALLAVTRPRLALISVGTGNDYGHPTKAALTRLREAGAQVHRTDLEGTLTVELRADGLRLTTSGARRVAVTGYDPSHDRPGAPRGRATAALPGATRLVPRARVRRGGRGGLAGAQDRGAGARGGRGRGGGGGAPARRGQAARRGPPGGRPARRRIRALAGGTRPAAAGANGPGPPGDPFRIR